MENIETSWVTIELDHQEYAIRTSDIREMALLGKVTRIPNSPDYIRGVVNVRGHILTVIDLRKRLGLPSLQEEIATMSELLKQREQDHVNWLTELKKSIEESRQFRLTTDPHQCAFGKWYDNYKTDNLKLYLQLKKFDTPHQHIHGIGKTARELLQDNRRDDALMLIEQTWHKELSAMIQIFSETRSLLSVIIQEIIVLVEHQGKSIGLTADAVREVLQIEDHEITPADGLLTDSSSHFVYGLGTIKGEVKILLNLGKIVPPMTDC